MRAAVGRSGDTRFLLITAGDIADEGHAATYIAGAAPDRVQTWSVDGAAHTDGPPSHHKSGRTRVTTLVAHALDVRTDDIP